ncbi:hypothetical protein Pla163_20330 [Planctomycetes bacterium Pla163]|uniref:Uncharacterized protein n=1 Tax=Rohdeia mirabilis TaxID=2528008 RepID=A0A518D0C4_9BACT|nr:hypothetical protein Pla163_20330 [Planctomycetes bacterium Pla163]
MPASSERLRRRPCDHERLGPGLDRPSFARLAAPILAALALVCAGCKHQVWPGPMEPVVTPLPDGLESIRPGLDEVLVTRLADPVRYRPAGTVGSIPFTYVDKRRRLAAGSSIHVATGGRAEIAWPGETLIVQVFDSGHVRVGVRERGEPAAILFRPTRARLDLPPGTRIRIEDVCDLLAPEGLRVGPLLLERTLAGPLRLFNNGATEARLDFGDTRLELGPSQSIDLVEIDRVAVDARAAREGLDRSLPLPDGDELRWRGPLELGLRGSGVLLSASGGPIDVDALGSLWHLEAGSSVHVLDDPSEPFANDSATNAPPPDGASPGTAPRDASGSP